MPRRDRPVCRRRASSRGRPLRRPRPFRLFVTFAGRVVSRRTGAVRCGCRDASGVRRFRPRGLSLPRPEAFPPCLLPGAGGLRRGARPAADRHHAAPARQECRCHDAPSGLCAGAGSRLPRGDRLLLRGAGLEVQPPRAADSRVARIRRLFPRYDDQARRPAAGLYPHGRRGGGRGAAGRTAVGRTRGFAHGQPRGLLHPGRFV